MISENNSFIDDTFFTLNRGRIYAKVIEHVEKELIEKALQHSCGNQIIAARVLGINRNTLHTKIRRLHINVGRFKG
ncbi:helix-turn-helix domain-containing protein [Candidatus Omnitrophota bacterium]